MTTPQELFLLLAAQQPEIGRTTDLGPQPLWTHLLKVLLVFVFLLVATMLFIWGERRILGRMQARIGPNRAGPAGILQTLADGVKLFFKEDINPRAVDWPVYVAAPLIAPLAAFLAFAIVPFGGRVELFHTTFDLQLADPDIGVLWFLAMGSIHVYSVVLAGYASGSAYPLLGGVRSAAQMISYEIALGLSVAAVFAYGGTMRVSEIIAAQTGPGLVSGWPNWFVVPLFPAFALFLTALTAETGRPPFDLPEAEGELVAGFHTEYSGIRFAMFFLGEFMSVITGSAIIVTLFFGGPSGPVLFADVKAVAWIWPVLWFLLKTFVFMFAFIWMRATLPRMRYDRLMQLGWRGMLPIGFIWVLAVGFMVVSSNQLNANQRNVLFIGGITAAALIYVFAPVFSQGAERVMRRPEAEGRAFPDPEKEPEEIVTR